MYFHRALEDFFELRIDGSGKVVTLVHDLFVVREGFFEVSFNVA